jgi:hypothetical protein
MHCPDLYMNAKPRSATPLRLQSPALAANRSDVADNISAALPTETSWSTPRIGPEIQGFGQRSC